MTLNEIKMAVDGLSAADRWEFYLHLACDKPVIVEKTVEELKSKVLREAEHLPQEHL